MNFNNMIVVFISHPIASRLKPLVDTLQPLLIKNSDIVNNLRGDTKEPALLNSLENMVLLQGRCKKGVGGEAWDKTQKYRVS